MRALTRIRTLAAALMLLLFIATTALAGVPGRPKDRPEGPAEPNPAEVGDPDMGSGLQAYFRQLLAAALMSNRNLRWISLPRPRAAAASPTKLLERLRKGPSQ